RMDAARRELLAGTGRTDDEDAAVGRRDLVDGLAQLVDRRGAPHQGVGQRRPLLELLDLALEPRGLQRPLGNEDEPIRLERLLDEVVGAALDGGDRGLDIAVAGDHHHRQVGMLALDRIEQLQAVEPAALEPDIQENQARTPRRHRAKRLVAVARRARAVTFVLQDTRHQLADIRFIVDDENVSRHDYLSLATRRILGSASPASVAFELSCVPSVSEYSLVTISAAATRSRTHARRPPFATSGASASSSLPPCSSRIFPTIANPSPVPFSRVVT